jgi:hypothetical protein
LLTLESMLHLLLSISQPTLKTFREEEGPADKLT